MVVHLNTLPQDSPFMKARHLETWVATHHQLRRFNSTRLFEPLTTEPPAINAIAAVMCVTKGCGANYKNSNGNRRHGSGFDLMSRCRRQRRRRRRRRHRCRCRRRMTQDKQLLLPGRSRWRQVVNKVEPKATAAKRCPCQVLSTRAKSKYICAHI